MRLSKEQHESLADTLAITINALADIAVAVHKRLPKQSPIQRHIRASHASLAKLRRALALECFANSSLIDASPYGDLQARLTRIVETPSEQVTEEPGL